MAKDQTEKVERVKVIDLSAPAVDENGKPEPLPTATPYVQQALMDPEIKKVFEMLIFEIRMQMPGNPNN